MSLSVSKGMNVRREEIDQ